MERTQDRIFSPITYKYWIYILTILTLTGFISYFSARQSDTGVLDTSIIIKNLIQIFITSSISWFVGKRYKLNYGWICILGAFGYALIRFLIEVFGPLIFRGLFEFMIFVEMLPFIFFSSFVFGGIFLIISYPIQYFYFKLRNR